MSKATGSDQLDEMMREIFERLRTLEQPTRIKVPLYAADPSSPRNGEFWVNTTSLQFKVRVAGVTRVATLT